MDSNVQIPEIITRYINEVASKYTNKKIELKTKTSSKLIKFLGWFFIKTNLNPKFMEAYYTTIGNTIYYPENLMKTRHPLNSLEIVAHETIHIKDENRLKILYYILYFGPQIFAVLSIFSFFAVFLSKTWLICLLFLLFAAPIPSYGRYYLEKKAYYVSIIFAKYLFKASNADLVATKQKICDQLSKKYYYFAWPFPKLILKDIEKMSKNELIKYKDIIEFILKI
jgi:hypothetical protein